MKQDGLSRLLEFLSQLRDKGIHYALERQDPESLMVSFVAGEHFVEAYFDSTEVWFSYFKQQKGGEMTEDALANLLQENWRD